MCPRDVVRVLIRTDLCVFVCMCAESLLCECASSCKLYSAVKLRATMFLFFNYKVSLLKRYKVEINSGADRNKTGLLVNFRVYRHWQHKVTSFLTLSPEGIKQ